MSRDAIDMPRKPPSKQPAGRAGSDRKARLAEALRENLKRRKAQARDRKDDGAKGPTRKT